MKKLLSMLISFLLPLIDLSIINNEMGAFINTNAVARGNETVDTKFSALVEPNLFPAQIFQPGITFTEKHQTDAMGQLFVRKLGKGTVDTSTDLTFTHNQTADELISIVLDKPFKQSEAVYEAVEIARNSGTGVQKFEVVMSNVKAAWQLQAHTTLVAGATASATTIATTTAALAKSHFIAVRKELVDNYATPETLIASTLYYSYLLDYSGREYQPASNDTILRTGSLGRFFGANVYESAQLVDDGTIGSIEFVLYEKEAYSILSSLVAARIIDAGKDWVGSAAQVHIISGFKVTTAERVYKKTVA